MSRTLDDYRGAHKWDGLMPAVTATVDEDRVWDEGFRSFLVKYGMFNHVVYDVFVAGGDKKQGDEGLDSRCRFSGDLKAFTEKGLVFRYVDHKGEEKTEYDFSEEYHIVGMIIASPSSFFIGNEDNWFGFVALSNDKTELVIVFRGTLTTFEWIENATCTMEHLRGTVAEEGWDKIWNRKDLMVHAGFQQLYEETPEGKESPKTTVRRLVEEHKDTLDKITCVGHSLGGAIAQLCAMDLAHHGVSGDVPVTAIAFASPKVGNARFAERAATLHPKLRVLRLTNPVDSICNMPPDWFWFITTGGFRHMGVELSLSNKHLVEKKMLKNSGGAHHNLQMILHNIDPTRDVALMNKWGDPLEEKFSRRRNISPYWHSLTFPRTIYHT